MPSASFVVDSQQVNALLNRMHAAASKGDVENYLSCFVEDGVFVGTDASEYWNMQQLSEKVREHFRDGTGWTYVPFGRKYEIESAHGLGWFYERLKNEKYGEARGSGVVRFEEGKWRIVQYVLSFPVPNELCDTFAHQVRGLQNS